MDEPHKSGDYGASRPSPKRRGRKAAASAAAGTRRDEKARQRRQRRLDYCSQPPPGARARSSLCSCKRRLDTQRQLAQQGQHEKDTRGSPPVGAAARDRARSGRGCSTMPVLRHKELNRRERRAERCSVSRRERERLAKEQDETAQARRGGAVRRAVRARKHDAVCGLRLVDGAQCRLQTYDV